MSVPGKYPDIHHKELMCMSNKCPTIDQEELMGISGRCPDIYQERHFSYNYLFQKHFGHMLPKLQLILEIAHIIKILMVFQ